MKAPSLCRADLRINYVFHWSLRNSSARSPRTQKKKKINEFSNLRPPPGGEDNHARRHTHASALSRVEKKIHETSCQLNHEISFFSTLVPRGTHCTLFGAQSFLCWACHSFHFISIREPRLVGSGKMRGQRQCPARRAFVVQSLCDRWRGGGGGGAKECVVSEDLRRQVGFGVDTAKTGAVRVGPEARRLATRARAPLGRRKLRLLAAGTVGCHRFACVQDRRACQYASAVIDHHN